MDQDRSAAIAIEADRAMLVVEQHHGRDRGEESVADIRHPRSPRALLRMQGHPWPLGSANGPKPTGASKRYSFPLPTPRAPAKDVSPSSFSAARTPGRSSAD